MTLGEKLKEYRRECNLTIREMAKKFEFTPTWLSRLENDRTTAISEKTAHRIAEVLGIPSKEVFRVFCRLPKDRMKRLSENQDLYDKVWEATAKGHKEWNLTTKHL